MENREFEIGDLFMFPTQKGKCIYRVVGVQEDGSVSAIIVFPIKLAQSTKGEGYFKLFIRRGSYLMLGNVYRNKLLKLLYE